MNATTIRLPADIDKKPPSREQITLRLSPELKELIQREADKNEMSVNQLLTMVIRTELQSDH